MASLNKVQLIGHLGKDPEMRTTQAGKRVANFSLATSEEWKDKATGEKRSNTQWHNVVIFNEALANVAEKYLKKGSKCYIEGALQTRKWQDNNGNDKYTTEVVLQAFNGTLILLSGNNEGGQQQAKAAAQEYNDTGMIGDDIPF